MAMNKQEEKYAKRTRRKLRTRKHIRGDQERPRLSIYRSLAHIYAQVIDDDQGRTLCAVSSLDPTLRKDVGYGGNVKAAQAVGMRLAQLALEKGIKKVVFDRGHAPFHGRVKALAEAARKGGLQF
jgi:large subunit ribosomal protein L18